MDFGADAEAAFRPTNADVADTVSCQAASDGADTSTPPSDIADIRTRNQCAGEA